jgi:hypothetical protein
MDLNEWLERAPNTPALCTEEWAWNFAPWWMSTSDFLEQYPQLQPGFALQYAREQCQYYGIDEPDVATMRCQFIELHYRVIWYTDISEYREKCEGGSTIHACYSNLKIFEIMRVDGTKAVYLVDNRV